MPGTIAKSSSITVKKTRRPTPRSASAPPRRPEASRREPTPRAGVKTVAAAPPRAEREPEKPRFKLIAGTGAVLTLLFICLIILNSSLQVSAITIDERMSVGDVSVRHETWEHGNSIVDVASLDPTVADVEIFLVQDEEQPGFVHFLVSAAKEGEASIVIQYENKDRKIIHAIVEPAANPIAPGKEDHKSKADALEKVRELLRVGDELMVDGDKGVENTFKAYASYQKALRALKQIRLHQFLPEYKGLEEKIRKANDQVEVRYKKAEAEYQVARDRKMDWKARELVKVLMQIVPDPKDPRYLKNRTYLDYLHHE